MNKYFCDADGKIFINDVPLKSIEDAIELLQNAGLDATSVVMSLSFVLPEQEVETTIPNKPPGSIGNWFDLPAQEMPHIKIERQMICAMCCAAGIKCNHKGMHMHPHDCKLAGALNETKAY